MVGEAEGDATDDEGGGDEVERPDRVAVERGGKEQVDEQRERAEGREE